MPSGVLHCLLFSLVWDLYSYFLAFWLNTNGQIWLNYLLFPHITPLVSKRCILAYHYLRISDVSKTVLFKVITSLSLFPIHWIVFNSPSSPHIASLTYMSVTHMAGSSNNFHRQITLKASLCHSTKVGIQLTRVGSPWRLVWRPHLFKFIDP